LNDDFVSSAAILKELEKNNSSLFENDNYISIVKKVYYEAGKKLYNEGFSSFKKRDYDEAVKMFIKSHEYAPDENFSDECLYYTAYSKFYLNDKNGALDYMNELVTNYPESNLIKNAKRFINKHGK
jgi:outer membrane protein assembly factor BamD (BamD/ComL family)